MLLLGAAKTESYGLWNKMHKCGDVSAEKVREAQQLQEKPAKERKQDDRTDTFSVLSALQHSFSALGLMVQIPRISLTPPTSLILIMVLDFKAFGEKVKRED